jgi:hypothetical protein
MKNEGKESQIRQSIDLAKWGCWVYHPGYNKTIQYLRQPV